MEILNDFIVSYTTAAIGNPLQPFNEYRIMNNWSWRLEIDVHGNDHQVLEQIMMGVISVATNQL